MVKCSTWDIQYKYSQNQNEWIGLLKYDNVLCVRRRGILKIKKKLDIQKSNWK